MDGFFCRYSYHRFNLIAKTVAKGRLFDLNFPWAVDKMAGWYYGICIIYYVASGIEVDIDI